MVGMGRLGRRDSMTNSCQMATVEREKQRQCFSLMIFYQPEMIVLDLPPQMLPESLSTTGIFCSRLNLWYFVHLCMQHSRQMRMSTQEQDAYYPFIYKGVTIAESPVYLNTSLSVIAVPHNTVSKQKMTETLLAKSPFS